MKPSFRGPKMAISRNFPRSPRPFRHCAAASQGTPGEMTKRAYPFEVGVLRQFKTHVHTIDCDKAAMKDIQSKTIEKLFLAQKSNAGGCHNTSPAGSCMEKEKSMKQKQLSNYFMKKNGNPLEKEAKCTVDFGNRTNNCTYCDKISGDIYECSICFEKFCQSCSFADYNSAFDEVRICMTCS